MDQPTAPPPTPPNSQQTSRQARSNVRNMLIGGLLPVLAFAFVEEAYGTMGGLIAGIVFGAGELIYERIRLGKMQKITIASNLLVIILGGFSLFESNPVFFKLQPAILIFVFAMVMLGSSAIGKPFLVEMSKKQRPDLPPVALEKLKGMNTRLGFVLIGISALSVHAAYAWSTAAWAALKGIGAPVILLIYMAGEFLYARWRAGRR